MERSADGRTVVAILLEHVEHGSTVYTDAAPGAEAAVLLVNKYLEV